MSINILEYKTKNRLKFHITNDDITKLLVAAKKHHPYYYHDNRNAYDDLKFWLFNLNYPPVEMCGGFDECRFNQLLQKYKIDLSPYIIKSKNSNLINRSKTKEKVFEILSNQITKDSKITKGALMRYVRENFEGQSVYSDVGRVASKIIKLETSRTGRWKVCTTARHIRRK
tara:strand:- start:913 stop:1425 length:513 start_codon:yes stop_codon:yes gene_type:complete